MTLTPTQSENSANCLLWEGCQNHEGSLAWNRRRLEILSRIQYIYHRRESGFTAKSIPATAVYASQKRVDLAVEFPPESGEFDAEGEMIPVTTGTTGT